MNTVFYQSERNFAQMAREVQNQAMRIILHGVSTNFFPRDKKGRERQVQSRAHLILFTVAKKSPAQVYHHKRKQREIGHIIEV